MDYDRSMGGAISEAEDIVQDTWKVLWPKFLEQLERKMAHGAKEYGDASFHGSMRPTLEELQQEAIDITGWGYILYCKIQRFKERAARLQALLDEMDAR